MWSWPAPPFSALRWIGMFKHRSATHKTVTHPSTNLYLCCILTSNSLHSTISPLSYWYSSWLDVAWLDLPWLDLSWFDLSWLDLSRLDMYQVDLSDLICLYCPINQTLKVSRKAIWHLLEDLYHTNGKDGKLFLNLSLSTLTSMLFNYRLLFVLCKLTSWPILSVSMILSRE